MKRLSIIPALFAALALTACAGGGAQAATDAIRTVSGAEAEALIAQAENYVIVDVRTPEEFAAAHVAGAINIPVETIADAPAALANKDQTIFLYCRSGNRSAQAAGKLAQLGYTDLVDFGGLSGWPGEVEAG